MSEKIKDVLIKHQGRLNAIATKRISKVTDSPLEDMQPANGIVIHGTSEEYGLPLSLVSKTFL